MFFRNWYWWANEMRKGHSKALFTLIYAWPQTTNDEGDTVRCCMSPATTGQQGSHSPKQEVCFLLALCLLRMYEIWGPWASCPWVLCKTPCHCTNLGSMSADGSSLSLKLVKDVYLDAKTNLKYIFPQYIFPSCSKTPHFLIQNKLTF